MLGQKEEDELESMPSKVLPLSYEVRCKSQVGGASYRYNTFLRQVDAPSVIQVKRESKLGLEHLDTKRSTKTNFVSKISREDEEEILRPHPRYKELLRKNHDPEAIEQALQLRIYKSVPKNRN